MIYTLFSLFHRCFSSKSFIGIFCLFLLLGSLVPAALSVSTQAGDIGHRGAQARQDRAINGLPLPTILEVQEGDRHAIIYWNSKTASYADAYDSDKLQGVYSYLIEWGEQGAGFPYSEVTPYRAYLVQPLTPGMTYEARLFNLDAYGNRSQPSEVVLFEHDSSAVDALRERMTGFFDDFNQSMGPFDELKWNFAHSGCVEAGQAGHHINHEFHAHTISKSVVSGCDRAVSDARARELFDFTDRTGTIEFDLDGSKQGRQFWYLDLYPAGEEYTGNGKRDLSGHVALDLSTSTQRSDPAYLLRIVEKGTNGSVMQIKFADANGEIKNLADLSNIYRNGACGANLRLCEGENLETIPNVRRHFRIELSRTEVRMYINDILVVDGSLAAIHESGGLPYQKAHVMWLLFSYNTTKENIHRAMVHWDNFGFDAPPGYEPTTITHNYIDGRIGPSEPAEGTNDSWGGPRATMTEPVTATIPIPDAILDTQGNAPQAELMFTLQGNYIWTEDEQFIMLNEGSANEKVYSFTQPTSQISDLPFDRLIGPLVPHSVVLPLDIASDEQPGGLIQGDNLFSFYLDQVSVFNIHVELTYPIETAPDYTPPSTIFPSYPSQNMPPAGGVGPGIRFEEIDGEPLWNPTYYSKEVDERGDPTHYIKHHPLSGEVPLVISGNVDAQMVATGHATGITHYDILIDQQVVSTINVNAETPIAYFTHDDVTWDSTTVADGTYELFMIAYDPAGNPSFFDQFLANAEMGEYIPIIVTVDNTHAKLEGHIELQGRGDLGSEHWIEPITIELTRVGESQPSYTFERLTDKQGNYSLSLAEEILPDIYDMRIQGAHSLATTQQVSLQVGDNSIPSVTLLEGDANHDNAVTLVDFSILSTTFNNCGDALSADFNRDYCVMTTDLSLLISNFGQTGDNLSLQSARVPQDDVFISIAPIQTAIISGQPFTISVEVEAGSELLDGAAAYLNFDPTILQVQQQSNASTFPIVLQNTVDNKQGHINFAAGTTSAPYKTNTFTLLTMQFMPLAPSKNSELTFNSTIPRQTDATFGGASILTGHTGTSLTIEEVPPATPTASNSANLYLPLMVKGE